MRDIGGFDQSKWTARVGENHKSTGFELLQCNTKEKVKEKERETGVRYSELFRLPYHDPVRCHVIDPMHNLFLGINVQLTLSNSTFYYSTRSRFRSNLKPPSTRNSHKRRSIIQ